MAGAPPSPDPNRDPNDPIDNVGERVWERYRIFSHRFGGRFKLSVALGIVIVSVFAAGMAWRASVWGERSANTDELTRQDQVELERILSSQTGQVNQDIRVFNSFEEATLLAQELAADSNKVRAGQARLELQLEAGSQRAEAKSQRRFFGSSQPSVDQNTGQVTYDAAFAQRVLRSYSPDLEVLRPNDLREEARVAGIKAVRLTGLAALFVAALLFLTLAEVTRRPISGWFAGSGAATAVIALGLYFFWV